MKTKTCKHKIHVIRVRRERGHFSRFDTSVVCSEGLLKLAHQLGHDWEKVPARVRIEFSGATFRGATEAKLHHVQGIQLKGKRKWHEPSPATGRFARFRLGYDHGKVFIRIKKVGAR